MIDDELKRTYRDGLSSSIEALEAARKELGEGNSEVKVSIKRVAHSLHGSGGTYGFPEISEAAGETEQASDADLDPKVERLIEVLRRVASGTGRQETGILIIDDDPAIYELLRKKLSGPNRRIHVADNLRKAEEFLEESELSLIVLDLVLPDGDGRNLLARLRERRKTALVPVVVLSAGTGAVTKTECFALGADDYFEKPFDPETLASAVSARLERMGELRRESVQDTLTGVSNRASLHESFTRMISLSARLKQPLCISLIDLDHFKAVNDLYGHPAGDEVLGRVGSILSQCVRQSDILGRWGGEEFLILFPSTDLTDAVGSVEKALHSLQDEVFRAGGRTFRVTFSAGVAAVKAGVSMQEAVSDVDWFLYQAKDAGRNRVVSEKDSISREKGRILVAEDDDPTASIIVHRFRQEGFEVLRFADGAAALAGAQEAGFCLVMLDVNMPGINGFELLQKLRRMPAYSGVPIVMLTAMGSEEDIARGFELGANDYILKPFSPVELVGRVHRLLRRH